MIRAKRTLAAALTVILIGFGAALPAKAHGPESNNMGQQPDGRDGSYMGRGMMGPGMMGYGMPGYGMAPGMMGYGMAPGMMGYGMAPGMMAPLRQDLTTADVQHMMGHRLAWSGNPHIKLGKVEQKDDDTITVEIVTQDGSLVDKLEVDRHTGYMQPVR